MLPDALADKMAKLSLKSGVKIEDSNLFYGVRTIKARYPLGSEFIQRLFTEHGCTMQVVELMHADFRGVDFGDNPYSELKSLTLVKARNFTQIQFAALCALLPAQMEVLIINECANITLEGVSLPKVAKCVFVPAESHNPFLELSVDDE